MIGTFLRLFGLLGLGFLLFGEVPAFAYPDMVRHGYTNCTSCHVSPTGGGTLTPYGRQLSREVLSTWAYEGEEKPAYFINSPDWLDLGGDYRSAYYYENTPKLEQGQYQFMQLDLEAAANYKAFTFDASAGYQDPAAPNTARDYLISRTHYVMYHATDQLALRFGRFFPAYGIQTPNHALLIRDTLNIHEPEPLGDGESYNLEGSYIGDTYNVLVTGIFGRPDDPSVQRDIGASVVVSRALGDSSKVGLSYLYGTNDLQKRNVIGPYGMLGFTQHFYLLTEMDFQALTLKTAPGYNPVEWGMAETSRLGYEIVQGLNFIIDQEFARTQFANPNTLEQRYGAGIWWFPRPHLEASLEYQQRQNKGMGYSDFYDYIYFLWHIYI
ncbi:MAG: hypothetical protein P4M08_06355 [Oligoflexia bacterium]|nr:hypothetical protein [Oligoflexia bacterium]